jgi:hypothetical protein
MRARRTDQFTRAYDAAPERLQRAFDKQLRFLLDHGPSYPSLDVHPWPAHGPDARQARLNKGWRFYYYVEGDTYVIYGLQAHPKSTQRGR